MLIRYTGPPDQADSEIAAAFALARADKTTELPDSRPGAAEGATVTVSDVAGDAPAILEPGRVYDLPPRMATHRLETSAHWEKVTKIADLPVAELRRIAGDRGVEGRSEMDAKKLAKAVSAAPAATLPEPSPETAAPAGGAPAPAGSPTAAPTTAPAAAPTTATPTPGGTP